MELQRRAFPFKEVSRVQRILGTPLEYICVSLKGKVTQYWIICTCPRRCLLLDPLRHSWPALAMLFLLYLICFIWKCSGQCCHLYCWRSYRELLISICAVFHWQNHIGNSGNLPKWYIISQSKTRENSSKELVNCISYMPVDLYYRSKCFLNNNCLHRLGKWNAAWWKSQLLVKLFNQIW